MDKKEQTWLSLFLLFPVLAAYMLADSIAPDNKMEFLYAALFGGVGAIVSFGIFSLTKGKETKARVISLSLVIAVLATSIVIASTNGYPRTCYVCGYKAIEKGDTVCGECFEEVSEERMREKGYNSISELIFARQLYVFYQDSLETLDFYKPDVSDDGYKKDKDWKPLITKEDLIDIQKDLEAEK